MPVWLVLGLAGLVWTQLVWGPCWAAGKDYGLPAGVRITVMTVAGGALLLPFVFLNVVHDTVWLLYAILLAPYGLVCGAVGGIVLAARDRTGVRGSST